MFFTGCRGVDGVGKEGKLSPHAAPRHARNSWQIYAQVKRFAERPSHVGSYGEKEVRWTKTTSDPRRREGKVLLPHVKTMYCFDEETQASEADSNGHDEPGGTLRCERCGQVYMPP